MIRIGWFKLRLGIVRSDRNNSANLEQLSAPFCIWYHYKKHGTSPKNNTISHVDTCSIVRLNNAASRRYQKSASSYCAQKTAVMKTSWGLDARDHETHRFSSMGLTRLQRHRRRRKGEGPVRGVLGAGLGAGLGAAWAHRRRPFSWRQRKRASEGGIPVAPPPAPSRGLPPMHPVGSHCHTRIPVVISLHLEYCL